MFKDQNIFRDFLFALALISLIRLVYQQRAGATLQKINSPKTEQKSRLEKMIYKTEIALKKLTANMQVNNHSTLQKDLASLKERLESVNQQYHKKIKQEDAITYLLGPLYSVSKVAKERVLTKRLDAINEELSQIRQQDHRPQEKTFSRIATAHL